MARKLQSRERGNISEMLFKVEATKRGFQMCEPICDIYRYDNVVQSGHTFWRLQVKSTDNQRGEDVFQANSGHGRGKRTRYRKSEIDFVAFHIIPTNTWYIVPLAALRGRTCVTLYGPERRHEGMFAEYYEAWHLLRERRPCTFCLHASAETPAENSVSRDLSRTPAEVRANSGLLWGGMSLDERNLRVMDGDAEGLGMVLQGVAADMRMRRDWPQRQGRWRYGRPRPRGV